MSALLLADGAEDRGAIQGFALPHRLADNELDDALDLDLPYVPTPEIRRVRTRADVDAALAALQGEPYIGLDVETTGPAGRGQDGALDPHVGRLRLVQFGTAETVWLFDCFADDVRVLGNLFTRPDGPRVVLHNGKFDLQWLWKVGIPVKRTYDTMLAHQVLYAGLDVRHGLAFVVRDVLGQLLPKYGQVDDWSVPTLSTRLLEYAARDVSVLLPLRAALDALAVAADAELPKDRAEERAAMEALVAIDPSQRWRLKELSLVGAVSDLPGTIARENRALPGFAWLEFNGVAVNTARWLEQAVEAEAAYRTTEARLSAYVAAGQGDATLERRVPDGFVPPHTVESWFASRPVAHLGTSWTSNADVKRILGELGIPLEDTRESTLAMVRHLHPLIPALLDFREAQKRTTTYGRAWLQKYVHPTTGRVHAQWRQIGAEEDRTIATGRAGCGDPNLQQIPGKPYYRRCFVPSAADHLLVKLDFSQYQLRILAEIGDVTAMLEAFEHGQDIHTRTAELISGESLAALARGGEEGAARAKHLRKVAKSANFGLAFGMSAQNFRIYAAKAFEIDFTLEEAFDLYAKFHAAYPEIRKYQRKQGGRVNNQTYTRLGRRRQHVMKFNEAGNSPIQGSEADGAKEAMAAFWERRDDLHGAKPVLMVHDEFVFTAPAAHAEDVAVTAWEIMTAAAQLGFEKVRMGVDAVIGPDWYEDGPEARHYPDAELRALSAARERRLKGAA